MKLTRLLIVLSAALVVAAWSARTRASTLSVIGASGRVCQLTGQADWVSGQPTDAKTLSNDGLKGVDLGFPVESGGQLLFLFGDTDPNDHPAGNVPPTVPPDDAVGFTTRTLAPDAGACLGMKMVSPAAQTLSRPVVTPAIQQGSFNVPTGGVEVLGQLYAFFWTNHCVFPNAVTPNAAAPLTLPPAGGLCLEIPLNNSLGLGVLTAAASSSPVNYAQAAPQPIMPNGFVYSTAAQPAPRLFPIPRGHGRLAPPPPIPVFGVPRYRASIPYLALAPRRSFADVTSWSFYAGMGPQGPTWVSYSQWQAGQMNGQWAPPAGAELYADSPNPNSPSNERCVGEHSVTWNAPLHAWLMLYTCGAYEVEARTAPQPWGPWSGPTVILSAVEDPSLFCKLLWNKPGAGGCPGLTSQQPPAFTFGYLYAPYVMSRFTKAVPVASPAHAAQIYWLLSTWDPYQVTVMQTTLQLAP